MPELRYTLLSDGSSDRSLLHVLTWLLRVHGVAEIRAEWADLRILARPPRGLADRILKSLDLHPCELLFVHRDAEAATLEERRHEIFTAAESALGTQQAQAPVVCVVTVRMQEAWFLLNESAIRSAAGNPNGRIPLTLPAPQAIERLPDPKRMLHDLLRDASERRGRRLNSFRPNECVHRLAEVTDSFAPLRCLSAFQALENDVRDLVARMGWRTV